MQLAEQLGAGLVVLGSCWWASESSPVVVPGRLAGLGEGNDDRAGLRRTADLTPRGFPQMGVGESDRIACGTRSRARAENLGGLPNSRHGAMRFTESGWKAPNWYPSLREIGHDPGGGQWRTQTGRHVGIRRSGSRGPGCQVSGYQVPVRRRHSPLLVLLIFDRQPGGCCFFGGNVFGGGPGKGYPRSVRWDAVLLGVAGKSRTCVFCPQAVEKGSRES